MCCLLWQILLLAAEVCNLPVRCAKFVTRKQWIATASDDMHVWAPVCSFMLQARQMLALLLWAFAAGNSGAHPRSVVSHTPPCDAICLYPRLSSDALRSRALRYVSSTTTAWRRPMSSRPDVLGKLLAVHDVKMGFSLCEMVAELGSSPAHCKRAHGFLIVSRRTRTTFDTLQCIRPCPTSCPARMTCPSSRRLSEPELPT